MTSFQAMNVRRREEVGYCPAVECAECPVVDETETTAQYFVPTCDVAKRCALIDIRQHSVTECLSDADCQLRDGSACCEGCDGQGLVSVSSQELFTALCGPLAACPDCASNTAEFLPKCEAGRCTVVHAYPPPPP
jgi:hypothetical protein